MTILNYLKDRIVLLLPVLLCLFFAGTSSAHELQPALLELRQTNPETYLVLWKKSARPDLQDVRPAMPAGCQVTSDVSRISTREVRSERYTLVCPGGLEGKAVSIEGNVAAIFDVLVRVIRLDGTTQIFRLNPLEQSAVIERAPSLWKRSSTFLTLGVEHILMGVDHLLFVLGLLLIVRNRWMLLKTITAFTLAHSITLAVATLGWANAPAPPLNAAIALSILFLGPEMVRARRGQTSLAISHPWIVAFAFGLLHGFGFASGLTALGLSHAEIPLALLLFNIGVELGQLFFVALILLLARSFRILEIRWSRWVEWLPPYVVGSLGAYWTIQRTVVLFAALR